MNAEESETVSPYREALLRAEKSQVTYRITERIMAHDTDTDPTNHRHGTDTHLIRARNTSPATRAVRLV